MEHLNCQEAIYGIMTLNEEIEARFSTFATIVGNRQFLLILLDSKKSRHGETMIGRLPRCSMVHPRTSGNAP